MKRTPLQRKTPLAQRSSLRASARAGTCGVGLKPSDLLTVRACEACHAVIDGRARAPDLPVEQLTLYVHEAHCRTLVEYEKEGLIHAE